MRRSNSACHSRRTFFFLTSSYLLTLLSNSVTLCVCVCGSPSEKVNAFSKQLTISETIDSAFKKQRRKKVKKKRFNAEQRMSYDCCCCGCFFQSKLNERRPNGVNFPPSLLASPCKKFLLILTLYVTLCAQVGSESAKRTTIR